MWSPKKIIVFVIGTSCLLVGVAMIILPGPAVVLIPLGLAILSLEFEWAQRLLDRLKSWIRTRNRTKEEDPS